MSAPRSLYVAWFVHDERVEIRASMLDPNRERMQTLCPSCAKVWRRFWEDAYAMPQKKAVAHLIDTNERQVAWDFFSDGPSGPSRLH